MPACTPVIAAEEWWELPNKEEDLKHLKQNHPWEQVGTGHAGGEASFAPGVMHLPTGAAAARHVC